MRFAESLAITAQLASAIVYRHDVTVSELRINPNLIPDFFAYPNTVPKGQHCGATMIGNRVAITAAHCFDSSGPTVPFNADVNGNTYQVTEVRTNNCFDFAADGPNSADLAIMIFDTDIVAADPAINIKPIFNAAVDGSELDTTFELIGYGNYGPIGGPYTTSGNVFHRGVNMFTKVSGNTLKYTMDENSWINWEAMAWSGDSGGPAFTVVNGVYKISGVNSAGDCCAYGNEDAYTRLGSTFAYQWIQQNIANLNAGGGVAVQECSVWADGAVNQFALGTAAMALLSYLMF